MKPQMFSLIIRKPASMANAIELYREKLMDQFNLVEVGTPKGEWQRNLFDGWDDAVVSSLVRPRGGR